MRKHICLLLLSLFALNAVAATPAEKLILRLQKLAKRGVMYGHQDDPVYGHAWKWEEGRSDVKETCGDYPAVMGFDLGHLEIGREANLDGVPFDRMRREIIAQDKRGGISTLSWHATNPTIPGGTAWIEGHEYGTEQLQLQFKKESATVANILSGGAYHAKFLTWLDAVSDFLLSLRNEKGELIPVIFRPWHEHTGSWFWWGERICTEQQYKDLWKLTVNHLRQRGVTNAVYAYSPGSEFASNTLEQSSKKYLERYPGDEYIDLMGMDTYCNAALGHEAQFRETLTGLLTSLTSIAQAHNKVAALTETGYESLPCSDWWTNILLPAIESSPISYVLTWRNAHDKPTHFYGPFKGFKYEDDFKHFYQSKKTLFVKNIKKIK